MIRLFVALALPEEVRNRLSSLCRGIRDARWVEPHNMHLTLCFIGAVEEPAIDDLVYSLDAVRAPAFPLTLAGVGHFESRKRVRQIWAGIQPCPPLMDLQGRIEAAVSRAGVKRESRRFVPHVTLARLKDAKPSAVGPWLQANGAFRGFPFMVTAFTLFASYPGGSGPVYQPVEEFALDAAA